MLNISENIPSNLLGDKLRIKQILNNLLSNAFKYTKKGEVELSIDSKNSPYFVMLIFCVRDTGQGMTKEQVDKLFDEYSSFNPELNKTTEGASLGMAITQNLIHMMPVMDGIETTLKIRLFGKNYEKMPIIALTANTDCNIKETFLDNGFNGYITKTKPVIMEEMDKVINDWLLING